MSKRTSTPKIDILRSKFQSGEVLTREQIRIELGFKKRTSISYYLDLLSRYGLWIVSERVKGARDFNYKAVINE